MTDMREKSYLAGKRILAVDDEVDILESIEDILEGSDLDTARDYSSASDKIRIHRYDLVILDIMGVNGLKLLEESVARNFPTVMLTAHAMNPDTLLNAIRKGAIAYLQKETLPDLEELLTEIFKAHEQGVPPWKILFEKLGTFFDQRFGPNWKDKDKAFWADFDMTYQISKGLEQRALSDERVLSKGI